MHYKVWDEVTFSFPNANGATFDFKSQCTNKHDIDPQSSNIPSPTSVELILQFMCRKPQLAEYIVNTTFSRDLAQVTDKSLALSVRYIFVHDLQDKQLGNTARWQEPAFEVFRSPSRVSELPSFERCVKWPSIHWWSNMYVFETIVCHKMFN